MSLSFGSILRRFLGVGTALSALSLVASADEGQLRVGLNFPWQGGEVWTTRSNLQFRWNDEGDWTYVRAIQYFNRRLNDVWTFGLHPQVERARSGAGGEWKDSGILNFELNPSWSLHEEWSLKLRNRFEVGKAEGRNTSTKERLRQRTGLFWKPAEGLGPIREIGAQVEVFYDFDVQRVFRYRYTPLVVKVSPADSWDLALGYFYQTTWSASARDWRGLNVLEISSTHRF